MMRDYTFLEAGAYFFKHAKGCFYALSQNQTSQ